MLVWGISAVLCCAVGVWWVELCCGWDCAYNLEQLLRDVSDTEDLGMRWGGLRAYGVCNGLNASVTWGW